MRKENVNEETNKDTITKCAEIWSKLERLGTSSLFGSFQGFLDEVLDWERRDVPEEDKKQMARDTKEYLDYVLDCLKGKKKWDLRKALELHEKVKRWRPENYPLKKRG